MGRGGVVDEGKDSRPSDRLLERVQRGGGEYYEIWDYEISSSICVCSNYPRVLDAVRWS
jgi:hypothetical protein